jgi:hypothetical protein
MKHFLLLTFVLLPLFITAQMIGGPDRKAGEGDGPYDRLIIRGVTMIDGTGSPARGPMDIVIENNKIVDIVNVGLPKVPIDEKNRPKIGTGKTKEIDASGKYIIPGIIDLHVHTGGVPKAPEAEYVYKLWMANGITTVRGVPSGELEWSLAERERSAKNQIVAPRIISFHRPGSGKEWKDRKILTIGDAICKEKRSRWFEIRVLSS